MSRLLRPIVASRSVAPRGVASRGATLGRAFLVCAALSVGLVAARALADEAPPPAGRVLPPAGASPSPARTPALAPAALPPTVAVPAPSAGNAPESWRLGNEAFQRGQFAQAIDRYQRAIVAGGESADGYYNLGTAYYRLGRHGQAVLYLEKSLALSPRAGDARANLAIVRRHLDLDKQMQELGIASEGFWRRFGRSFTLDEVAIGFLSLYFLFFGALIGRRFVAAGTARSLLTLGAVLLITLTTLAGSFFAYRLYRQERAREGIVLEAKTPLMEPQGGSWKSVRALPEGLRVRIESHNDRWVQIRLPNGLSGYVKTAQLGAI